MTAPLVIRTMPDMVDVYRARIRELGLTHATVDALTGLPDGYTSKIMCGMKNPGTQAIELLNGALAINFIPQLDVDAIKAMMPRWTKRRQSLPIKLQGASIDVKIQEVAVITPVLTSRQVVELIGASMGGKRRAKRLKKRQRQRIAMHAARKRWAKRQAKAGDVA